MIGRDKIAVGNEWSLDGLLVDMLGQIAGWIACSVSFAAVVVP